MRCLWTRRTGEEARLPRLQGSIKPQDIWRSTVQSTGMRCKFIVSLFICVNQQVSIAFDNLSEMSIVWRVIQHSTLRDHERQGRKGIVASLAGGMRAVTIALCFRLSLESHSSEIPPSKSLQASAARAELIPGGFGWKAYCPSTFSQQICHLSLLTGIWKQGTLSGWQGHGEGIGSGQPRYWLGRGVGGGANALRGRNPVEYGIFTPFHCFARLQHPFIFCLETKNLGHRPKRNTFWGLNYSCFLSKLPISMSSWQLKSRYFLTPDSLVSHMREKKARHLNRMWKIVSDRKDKIFNFIFFLVISFLVSRFAERRVIQRNTGPQRPSQVSRPCFRENQCFKGRPGFNCQPHSGDKCKYTQTQTLKS